MKTSTERSSWLGAIAGMPVESATSFEAAHSLSEPQTPAVYQLTIDVSVALDFLVSWVLPEDEIATSLSETAPKLRIANERGRALLELRLIAEEQPRLAVVDH